MTATLEALAQELGVLLQKQGWQLALAESCTGGLVAQSVTSVAGSSAWFDRGFVTYSNAAKTDMLSVPEALLLAHGAVSEPVASAMALGALQHSLAQVAGAITGIAGPGGGQPQKPVGTVCFAWAFRAGLSEQPQLMVETIYFEGDRQQVREQAARHLLQGLQQVLHRNRRSPA